MVTLDTEVQVPSEIVQANMLSPTPNELTKEVGERELLIIPLPATSDQLPIPKVGVLAAKLVLGFEMHNVWLGPAIELPGGTQATEEIE